MSQVQQFPHRAWRRKSFPHIEPWTQKFPLIHYICGKEQLLIGYCAFWSQQCNTPIHIHYINSPYLSHLHWMLGLVMSHVLLNCLIWFLGRLRHTHTHTNSDSLQMVNVDEYNHTYTSTACSDCLHCRAASLHVESRLTLVINKLSVSAPRAATTRN